jgi:hypothetical protein
MEPLNRALIWWTTAESGGGQKLRLAVETETGKPIALKVMEHESLDTVAVINVAPSAAYELGQALMLAGTMLQNDHQQRD